jgi:glycerophosphoryl diester phosphodiesterase
MPRDTNLFGPLKPGLSALQRELEGRKRCYRETIIRGRHLTRPGWDKNWTATENEPYKDSNNQYKPSVCDILHYKKPQATPCKDLDLFAVLPLASDESIFVRIARLETVSRHPERQKEIFGWVPSSHDDPASQRSFALQQARYWKGPDPDVPPTGASFAESLDEVHSFRDTADFHANYLLRLIYLYGETPSHLRTGRTAWRATRRFTRDVNFSGQAEALVRTSLLEFKYWMDEPFYADDVGGAGLRWWRANRKTKAKRLTGDTGPAEDPEDDTYKTEMTFWSENHQILFATAEYLAGQLWPDALFRVGNSFRKEGPNKSRPTDLLGWQRMERARPRILRWLNDRLRFGFSEWNSPGYYDEDFTALFNLADFCLDEKIQSRACMVLDLLIFDLARFTHKGSFGVTAGRCYFEHKNCGYEQSVGDLIEILFGTRCGVIVERSSTCAGALVSSTGYQVPDVLMAIGQDQGRTFVDRSRVSINPAEAADYNLGFESDEDVMFWWSRNAYFAKQLIAASLDHAVRHHLMKTSPFFDVFPKVLKIAGLATDVEKIRLSGKIDPEVLAKIADLVSGVTEGPELSRANLYTYRSPAATLSSVQDFHAGQVAFQVQNCQATLSLGASVWTTYPAAGDVLELSGKPDGPNWWTGSATAPRVVQEKNAAIIAYKPKDLQLLLFGHRTHAWFPKAAFEDGSVIQRSGNCNRDEGLWTFGKAGDGYIGLFSVQRPQWTTDGLWANKELIAEGARNFFIIQVGGAAEFGSYQNFVDSVSHARIHAEGVSLVTVGEVAGTGTGLLAGAAVGGEVAGVPGAIVGAIGGAILGAKETAPDFECSYDIPGGGRLELLYDEGNVRYKGRKFSDDRFPRFENPYVKCGRVEWGQGKYTIKHNDYSLTHDFRAAQSAASAEGVTRLIDGPKGLEYDCSSGPRPFYVVGHNPNTIKDVIAALDGGANAIEPDVNVYEDRQGELCISETELLDSDEGGDADAPPLAQFLDDLHEVAMKRPELALVVFDCKPKVATAAHGVTLLREIRNRLTYDNEINVIISVSSRSETAIFDGIKSILGPREGCMIDEDNDPAAVASMFINAGVANRSYGNGSTFQSPLASPNLRPSIEHACGMRAGQNSFQFIYEWTNNDEERMREFIRTGVDGIISDDLDKLKRVSEEEEFQALIRYATRADNPFKPPNANYELSVHTGDVFMGATDANVTFTLTGSLGSVSKVVDTSLAGRMERNDWNFVTVQSANIGELVSVIVQRDDSGTAPDWYLDRILVESSKYGVSKQAVFDRWIDTRSPFTEPLI